MQTLFIKISQSCQLRIRVHVLKPLNVESLVIQIVHCVVCYRYSRSISITFNITMRHTCQPSRTNDEILEISRLLVRSRAGVQNLPHLDIFTRNDPHSYFSGFFITVNRSKQAMGDHLKTLASSFHVRFISNQKSFLPCQL